MGNKPNPCYFSSKDLDMEYIRTNLIRTEDKESGEVQYRDLSTIFLTDQEEKDFSLVKSPKVWLRGGKEMGAFFIPCSYEIPGETICYALPSTDFWRTEPLPCVFSRNEIKYERLDLLDETNITLEDLKFNEDIHSPDCAALNSEGELDDPDNCDCLDSSPDDSYIYRDAGLTIRTSELGYHVIESPYVFKRGLAFQGCCPGQCDSQTEGNILCYDLPSDLKIKED